MIIGKVTTSLKNTQLGSFYRSASRLEEERLKAVQELEEVDIPHVLVKLFNKHTNISLKVKKARQETLEVIENGELERPSSR